MVYNCFGIYRTKISIRWKDSFHKCNGCSEQTNIWIHAMHKHVLFYIYIYILYMNIHIHVYGYCVLPPSVSKCVDVERLLCVWCAVRRPYRRQLCKNLLKIQMNIKYFCLHHVHSITSKPVDAFTDTGWNVWRFKTYETTHNAFDINSDTFVLCYSFI